MAPRSQARVLEWGSIVQLRLLGYTKLVQEMKMSGRSPDFCPVLNRIRKIIEPDITVVVGPLSYRIR